MKLRTTALVLALSLSVSLLSACGGQSGTQQPAASAPSASVSTPAESTPDASAPATSTPGVSAPAEPTPMPEAVASLSLNKSDFTLFKAGETYALKAEATGTDQPLVWASSDENVATVAEDGTVTAVAPGSATITVTCGELSAQCIVRCDWEGEIEPAPQQPGTSAGTSVDLAAFYNEIMASGGDSSPAMMEVTGEYLDGFYPGLSQLNLNQCVVYTPMITAVACEVAMIECANAADVETVKSILQARIDNQVAGGAWYPDTIAGWENNSKIVVEGNYVALFVIPEGLMDAASAFSNLF